MSKLNCKPGDLAVVVAPRCGGHCVDTGKFAEVLELIGPGDFRTPDCVVVQRNGDDAAAWLIKYQHATLHVGIDGRMRTGFYTVMWDSRLRPIRNPGDDAIDESAHYLPPVPVVTLAELEAA